MTVSIREAFERGTEAFNAHDLDAFAQTFADDVAYRDGLFTAGDLMYDRLALLEQLGLVPRPAAH
jgi:hypothetical protein